MILNSGVLLSVRPKGLSRRATLRKNCLFRTARIESELASVEVEIENIALKARKLAEELGERYVVFRCEGGGKGDSRNVRDSEIMNLSRQTDDCIQFIYSLEKRRRELLRKLGK